MFCSKEIECESENETEVRYTSEDSESDYKLGNEVSDKAEMRKKLKNIIQFFFNRYQSENDKNKTVGDTVYLATELLSRLVPIDLRPPIQHGLIIL